jgi:hypothetical protein
MRTDRAHKEYGCQINETVLPARVGTAATICLSVSLAVLFQRPAVADAVVDWNANAAKAALAACIAPGNDPLHEARLYAMVHVAIHDALNAIDRRSRPYVYNVQGNAGASKEAAIAAAARNVLVPVINQLPVPPACPPAGVASVQADYTAAINGIPNGVAKTQGIQIGEAAAAAIVALRAGDGSNELLLDPDYPQGTEPGEFRFPPGTDVAFGTNWGTVTPFILQHASQFRPSPPFKVTSKKYAADFNEIKRLGGDGVLTPSARTAEQTRIARFWLESSPLAWNRIARTVSASRGLALWENARLFGLLNLALADGYVGNADTKVRYNFWRPVTAVHLANDDGNPDTVGDPAWTPLEPNYPNPDYDSGHSLEGGAAAEVFRQFFGTDNIIFKACSYTLPVGERCTDPSPVYREYTSFSQAAEENAFSRILTGLHFRDATEAGLKHGEKIGNRAVNLFLRPVR